MTLGTTVSIGKKPQPVILTDTAQAKVSQLLAEEEESGLALRVAVRPGGCSGFSYEMFFDSETAEDDVVSEFGDVARPRGPGKRRHAQGLDPRLQRRALRRRLPHLQPQRHPDLRLRLVLQLIPFRDPPRASVPTPHPAPYAGLLPFPGTGP